MPRIAGVDVPSDKRVDVALSYIYGIGRSRALEICRGTGVDPAKKMRDLSDEELSRIREFIDRNYKVEGELRAEIRQNIQRLIEINCYRGIRHRRGLPVRGQRTRTNARTRKGPRKTVAGKRRAKVRK
ncbi:MAG: 30S ribosomal protein S13 [Dehalococcoidia bacterium]|jgi:small subunit ribosomal protein S13|nr:30S ribosomal protein S13 [Dehalococcoidia bacterium]